MYAGPEARPENTGQPHSLPGGIGSAHHSAPREGQNTRPSKQKKGLHECRPFDQQIAAEMMTVRIA
jgi:hypothetical protein